MNSIREQYFHRGCTQHTLLVASTLLPDRGEHRIAELRGCIVNTPHCSVVVGAANSTEGWRHEHDLDSDCHSDLPPCVGRTLVHCRSSAIRQNIGLEPKEFPPNMWTSVA